MNSAKKYLVLGVLFLLPVVAYLFFASGVHNFAKLPILVENVGDGIQYFKTAEGQAVRLKDKITVLGFLGDDLTLKKGMAFNLNQKIYKKNHEFNDFQILILLPYGTEGASQKILDQLGEITQTDEWKFVFGTPQQIRELFQSLETPYPLDATLSAKQVFIIDKDSNLRGRDGQATEKEKYGYDASSVAELSNIMTDDIKVILAEYRLALKKYKADR